MAFRLKLGADGRVYGNPEHHFGNIFVSLKTEIVKTVSRREQRKKRVRTNHQGMESAQQEGTASCASI